MRIGRAPATRNGAEGQMPKPLSGGDDLLPYRRLVELQKQMIEMAHQHEQARRACDALREQVAFEIIARQRARRSPLHRFQQSTLRLCKRLATLALGAASFNPFRSTRPSSC